MRGRSFTLDMAVQEHREPVNISAFRYRVHLPQVSESRKVQLATHLRDRLCITVRDKNFILRQFHLYGNSKQHAESRNSLLISLSLSLSLSLYTRKDPLTFPRFRRHFTRLLMRFP